MYDILGQRSRLHRFSSRRLGARPTLGSEERIEPVRAADGNVHQPRADSRHVRRRLGEAGPESTHHLLR